MKAKDKYKKKKAEIQSNNKEEQVQNEDLLRHQRIKKLQKKTDAGKVSPNLEAFIVDVIYGKKWQADHLDKFLEEERNLHLGFLEHALNLLAGEDRDRFIDRIEKVLNEQSRNNIWEVEHVNIVNAIDSLAREKNRFAARVEIAAKTSYSHTAIDKHIEEYFISPYYQKLQEELQLMRERLLSRCYLLGTGGDMKAARLFLEVTARQRPLTTVQNQQNNFIQVNKFTITEDQINSLPEHRRQQMKEILGIVGSKELPIP